MLARTWVIDSSAIIDIKRVVPAGGQWGLLKKLEELVLAGQLYFPRQVAVELGKARYVDTPEAWALGVGPRVVRCYEPSLDTVKLVMSVAGEVVEVDSETEPADPYVLAQAIELRNLGYHPTVVTQDSIDRRPLKIAMTSACDLLALPHVNLSQFIADETPSP